MLTWNLFLTVFSIRNLGTFDGAYDKTPVYEAVLHHSPDADVVIPPCANSVEKTGAAPMRNRNIHEIKECGRMIWQKNRA